MDSADSPPLFRLPPEVLLHALSLATPTACAHFGLTCTRAHSLTTTRTLWRLVHSRLYDPLPPTSSSSPDHQLALFTAQVHARTQAQALVTRLKLHSTPIPNHHLNQVLATLVDLANSRSSSLPSLNHALLTALLPTDDPTLLALHPTFSRSGTRAARTSSAGKDAVPSPSSLADKARLAQLAAHLHALSTPSPLALSSPAIRTAAREIVYEKLNCVRLASWGPFMPDGSGRVDWRIVEALMLVMRANLDDAAALGWGTENDDEDDGETVIPEGWEATRAGSAGAGEVGTERDPRDWAGVETHEWRGTYAFLHWPTFVHFNRHRSGTFPPTLADEHEAVGDCMSLRLRLLPAGEWPEEIDQPDLSDEALARAAGEDSEGDADWAGAAGSEESSASEDDSDDGGDAYFATTSAAGPSTRSRTIVAVDDSNSDSEDESSPPSSPPTAAAVGGGAGRGVSEDAPFHALPGPGPLSPPPPMSDEERARGPFTLGTTFAPSPSPASPSPASASSSSAAPAAAAGQDRLAFHGTSERLAFRGSLANPGQTQGQRAGQGQGPGGMPRDRSIRGTVERTPEGAVRWSYVIRYGGADQWAMNGVQVAVGAKVGVVGLWSCADRSDDGPCGPFWYWPHCPDEVEEVAPRASSAA
ncbi:hypothetical protein JCM10207_009190 [Rhodosporidiobolus poonsookiae]